MSHRKSPYEHDVGGHYREGKYIDKYKRGKGNKPRALSKTVKSRSGGKPGFSVTFFFPGGRETYNVGGRTLTGAMREAIPLIQRPVVPTHAQIRRLKT